MIFKLHSWKGFLNKKGLLGGHSILIVISVLLFLNHSGTDYCSLSQWLPSFRVQEHHQGILQWYKLPVHFSLQKFRLGNSWWDSGNCIVLKGPPSEWLLLRLFTWHPLRDSALDLQEAPRLGKSWKNSSKIWEETGASCYCVVNRIRFQKHK